MTRCNGSPPVDHVVCSKTENPLFGILYTLSLGVGQSGGQQGSRRLSGQAQTPPSSLRSRMDMSSTGPHGQQDDARGCGPGKGRYPQITRHRGLRIKASGCVAAVS